MTMPRKCSQDRPRRLLHLRVTDNGVGLSSDRLRTLGSHGLGSMRHRMHAVGGQFSVHSVAGQGTEIEAAAPVLEEL